MISLNSNMLKIFCVALVVVGTCGKPRQEVSNSDLTDDDINFRVIGGKDAEPNEFPFMALLENYADYIFCEAVLISDYYLLTTAECLERRHVENVMVRLGEFDRSIDNESLHIDIPAQKFITHPKFTLKHYDYDIALIRLATPVPRVTHISPICLTSINDFDVKRATVVGWGADRPSHHAVNTLQKTDMLILEEKKCRDLLGIFQREYSKDKICGYEENKNICVGDRGGPLLWEEPSDDPLKKKRHLIGIASRNLYCYYPGKPALFTRLSSSLDWIKENTKDDNTTCWGN